MAISGISAKQYTDFLANGGSLVCEVDCTDVDGSGAFESMPSIIPNLDSGFEIPPSATALTDTSIASPLNMGDQWTRAVVFVYRRGGKVVYRRLQSGRYSAEATF